MILSLLALAAAAITIGGSGLALLIWLDRRTAAEQESGRARP